MATTISTDVFTKHGPGRYSEEVSTLSANNINLFTQLYVDSIDQGFILVCAQSGREVRMRLKHTHRDDVEGDTTHWTFEADPGDVRRQRIHPIMVQIWND